MTHRERFETILAGGVPDRTAWVPRLDIWYNAHKTAGTLPPGIAGLSLEQAEAFLGMAHSAREGVVHRVRCEGVRQESFQEGDTHVHRFVTPRGAVRSARTHLPSARRRGLSSIPTEHYAKTPEDLDVLREVAEGMRFEPDYERYRHYDREVGDRGCPMVQLGASPIHTVMLNYCGYERFYYFLADCPDRVHALVDALDAAYRRLWEVVADSPARFVLHGVHFNSAMTPPPIFRRYFLPYFRDFCARMHAAGIRVAFHADADLTGLLSLARECGFDAADCFACAPLVRTTFDEAWEAWAGQVTTWGGVPSILLEPTYPFAQFTRYVDDLLHKTAGRPRFILAVSDNIMPGAEFRRLVWIRDRLARA